MKVEKVQTVSVVVALTEREARILRALMNGVLVDRESVVASVPSILAISWIGARMATGQFEGIEDTLDQIEHRVTPGKASTEEMVVVDEVEFARLPAQVAMYRTALALLAGDIATTIDHAPFRARPPRSCRCEQWCPSSAAPLA